MTNRMKKTATFIIGAVLAFALVFTLAFALAPNTTLTASAATLDNTSTTWNEDSTIADDVTISGTVTVTANMTLTIPEGKTLTVGGGINAEGKTLTVTGKGNLVVTGVNGAAGSNGNNIMGRAGDGGLGGNGTSGSDGFIGDIIVTGATVTITGGNGGNGGNGGDGGSLSGDGGKGGNGGNGGNGVSGTITVTSGSATLTGGNGGNGGNGGVSGTYGEAGTAGTAGASGAGYSGTLTLGKSVKLYEGSDNTGTLLDGNDSASREYTGERKASMYVDGPDFVPHTHDYATVWSSDETSHWHACLSTEGDCDAPKGDEAAHTYAETTDTTAYYTCSVCGYLDATRRAAYYEANKIVDLSTLTGPVTVADGYTITGKLSGNHKVSVANGATVTLKDVNISNANDAGLTCQGNATIVLEGNNIVKSTSEDGKAGIFVPRDGTLTIKGSGSLTASSEWYGAGIGGNSYQDCGKIVIESGTITARSEAGCAGIGAAYRCACQGVEIKGGTVNAYGGGYGGAGIGSGGDSSNCQYITISGGKVFAQGGNYEDEWGGAGIGAGASTSDWEAYCEDITITGGNITAKGGPKAPAIGTGSGYIQHWGAWDDDEDTETYYSRCGTITITDGVGKLSLTKGNGSPDTIGRGVYGEIVWGMSVPSGWVVTESPFNYFSEGPSGVMVLIDEIPQPVVGTDACKKAIETARAAYDKLPNEDQKALVTNYSVLTDAEGVFDVMYVNAKINALPAVENITLNHKDAIQAARAAYDGLTTDEQRAQVTDYDKLTAAEEKYAELKEADDVAKANAVKDKIDAIGEVQNNSNVETKIAEAREAYDALTDDQKAKVGEDKYDTLTDAEATFVDFDIDDIGEVDLSEKCADKIEYARTAYDALTDEAKAKVTKLAVLEAAEKSYADLVAVDAVQTLIDDIGEVAYTAESKAKIDAAKAAFDALSADQRNLLNNAYKLNNAVQKYRILETTALIDAIGTVEYTADSKAKIDAARAAYDALGAKLQPAIENAETLTAAEAAYKALEDAAKANAAKALIEAIGTVEYTEDSKEKIDAAKEAYAALTEDQKNLVDTYETLTTAESTYATLKADNDAADEVKALITAIGEVAYSTESKAKIDAAREAYDVLTAEQKALVTNYGTLTSAEGSYANLKVAKEAEDAINALPASDNIAVTDKTAVAVAQAKYDALTPAQKAIVSEASVTKLTACGNMVVAQEVIVSIGDINASNPDSAKVAEARAAYDALTDEQKAKVTNYETLTAAEAKLAKTGLSGGAIAGIVIACIFGLAIIAYAVLYVLNKKGILHLAIVDKIAEKAIEIAKIVAAFCKKAWAKTVEFCKKAWAKTVEFCKKAWAKTVEFCKKAWAKTVEFCKKAWAKTVEFCKKVFAKVSEFCKKVISSIKKK